MPDTYTDPRLSPATLDCTCWTEGSTLGAPFRCAPCVAACVLIDALDWDEQAGEAGPNAIYGVTPDDVRDAVDRVAPDRLEGDPQAVLVALVALSGLERDEPARHLMSRRAIYAGQLRRDRCGVRPLPLVESWTEDLALTLLHGPGGVAPRAAVV